MAEPGARAPVASAPAILPIEPVKRKTWPWPLHGHEPTCSGKRDIGCAELWPAEAYIGRKYFRHRHEVNAFATGRYDLDTALTDCCNTDIARTIYRKAVEMLEA